MLKIRQILVALCGLLAFSGVAASSASAAWFVEGTELGAGSTAAVATAAVVDESLALLVPAVSDLKIECSASTLDGVSPEIVGGNTAKASSLKFLSCNTTHPASGCALEVTNQAITTLGINAAGKEASYPDGKLLVSPQTKNTLANFSFNEANTCAFAGVQPVKGSLTLNAPTLREEKVTQLIEGQGSVENNSLEIGSGNKAFVVGGKVLLKLASEKEFALFAPSNLFEWSVAQNKKIVTFTVKKKTGTAAAKVNSITPNQAPAGEWNLKGNDYKGCEGNYPEKGSCSFEVEYTNANGAPLALIKFTLVDENNDDAVTRFFCAPATCS
jgi:hypothetical protein